MTRKSPKKPSKTRREVKRFTSLPATRKEIRRDKSCDHEPDFTTACITLRENESCDVGVELPPLRRARLRNRYGRRDQVERRD
jgi:hypothetical protein